jgi:hypothetical protein
MWKTRLHLQVGKCICKKIMLSVHWKQVKLGSNADTCYIQWDLVRTYKFDLIWDNYKSK